MNERIEMYKSRDMGQVLNTTMSFIKQNSKALFRLLAVVVLPVYLAGSTLQSLAKVSAISTSGGTFANSGFDWSFYSIAGLILTFIASVLLSCTAVYSLDMYRENGKVPAPSEVFNRVAQHGWTLPLAYLLIGILFGVGYLILFGIITAISSIAGFIGIVIMIIAFLMIFILIIPFTLYTSIYLVERAGVFESISRSFELIKERWLRTVGLLLVILVMGFVAIMIPMVLITLATTGDLIIERAEIPIWLTVSSSVLATLLNSIFSVFTLMAFTVHYYSLREEKENLSLEQAIDNLTDEDLDTEVPNN